MTAHTHPPTHTHALQTLGRLNQMHHHRHNNNSSNNNNAKTRRRLDSANGHYSSLVYADADADADSKASTPDLCQCEEQVGTEAAASTRKWF